MSAKMKAPCAQGEGHTPSPEGYLAWHEWAAEKAKTHRQVRCPECGLWAIWVPIEITDEMVERACDAHTPGWRDFDASIVWQVRAALEAAIGPAAALEPATNEKQAETNG